MNDKEPLTTTPLAGATVPNEPERTLVSPHFDEASIRQARPAVPISTVRPKHSWLLVLAAAALVAGIIGGVIGSFMAGGFRHKPIQSAVTQTDDEAGAETETVATENTQAQTTAQPAAVGNEPAAADRPAPAPEAGVEAPEAKQPDQPSPDPVASLRESLSGWIDATNSRDIEKQMSFYDNRVQSFYRARNVTIADVRSEKARAFENARSIKVGAGEPQIKIAPDGRTAVMRFHKRYSIEGGGEDRHGEVVQELRWQLTGGRWKITSERDILVVR